MEAEKQRQFIYFFSALKSKREKSKNKRAEVHFLYDPQLLDTKKSGKRAVKKNQKPFFWFSSQVFLKQGFVLFFFQFGFETEQSKNEYYVDYVWPRPTEGRLRSLQYNNFHIVR